MLERELIRDLAVVLLRGFAGQSDSGTATTLTDTALAFLPNDDILGWDCWFEEGTNADVTVTVTDYNATTNVVTFAPAGDPAPGSVRYVLVPSGRIAILKRVIHDAWEAIAEDYPQFYLNEQLTLDDVTYLYQVPYAHETNLTIDAGSTTLAIRDAALTQANDYWNGATAIPTSGNAALSVRTVTDFLAATDDLVLAVPLPAAPAAGDTCLLLKPAPHSIYRLMYEDTDLRWQPIPDGVWELIHVGGVAYIRFPNISASGRGHQYARRWGLDHTHWKIPDNRRLRIIGMRPPFEPRSSHTNNPVIHMPIEIPLSVMRAWCRFLLHDTQARTGALDVEAHLQQKQQNFQMAQEARSRNPGLPIPANSRRVY